MKLTAIIGLAACLQVSAKTRSQTISLDADRASLKTIFTEIKRQTGFLFFYSDADLKAGRSVTIHERSIDLPRALDLVFDNQPLTYSIINKNIIVKLRRYTQQTLADTVQYSVIDVQGRVVNDSGAPVPAATILIRQTGRTFQADSEGRFLLTRIGPDATIVVSSIGYENKIVRIAGRLNIEVSLTSSTFQLDEAVVVNKGYYSEKKRLSTGNVSKVTSRDIEKQPVSNVVGTLQGRMAGVEVIQDAGTPGGGFQIKIRGQNSIRRDANEPLYIIDGVPYASQFIGSSDISTPAPIPANPINSINPADVESIEVLKDADATAIYGSRGANGVVLITTKKGKAGKATVSVTASKGAGRVTRFQKMMNTEQYLEIRRQAFANDGIATYPSSAYDINGTWRQDSYTDWQKTLTGETSSINDLRMSLTGGSLNTQYLFSGVYRNESTVFPGDFGYKKGGGHFSLNHQSDNNRFRFTFSTGYTRQKNLLPGANPVSQSRTLPPNAPKLFDEQGELNWEGSTFNNPLAPLRATANSNIADLLANTTFSYDIVAGLQLKLSMGYTDTRSREIGMTPSTVYDPAYGVGSEETILINAQNDRQSWIIEPQMNWQKTLGRSTLSMLAGASFQELSSSRLSQMGYGFSSNDLITMGGATSVYILGNENSKYRHQAFLSRINYSYQDKYVLNLTGRRDGSSRFGPGRQFAFFGAVGAAWIFSSEKFLANNDILSLGKLRFSYGTTGNDQIGDYQFYNTFNISGAQYQGAVGLTPTRLFNPDYSWEKNKKLEIGLELGFLHDRIQLGISAYRNTSSNQLVGIPLPGTTGFSSLSGNLPATVENKGIEVTLHSINLKSSNFSWTSNLNFSTSQNKLISFPGLEGSTYVNSYVIGQSINIEKLFNYLGLNQTTGLFEFEDVDKSGIVSGYPDRTAIRNLMPRFFGGLQNQLQYKSFELDFLFQFVSQNSKSDLFNLPGSPSNQLASIGNFWVANGGSATFQRPSTGLDGDVINAYQLYSSSTGTIQNGSYIRLKNISFSYDLSKHLKNKIKARVFLQGQNILTITSYSGSDPEFRYTGFLPPLKIYTAGIQLTIR
jgi:TonB-linked SusC/RagA family outer membrane protein